MTAEGKKSEAPILRNRSCPLERMVREALVASGLRFVRESKKSKNLDFFLPDMGVYIEIKGGFTERSTKQLHRDPNVILVQGVKSAEFIAKLLKAWANPATSTTHE